MIPFARSLLAHGNLQSAELSARAAYCASNLVELGVFHAHDIHPGNRLRRSGRAVPRSLGRHGPGCDRDFSNGGGNGSGKSLGLLGASWGFRRWGIDELNSTDGQKSRAAATIFANVTPTAVPLPAGGLLLLGAMGGLAALRRRKTAAGQDPCLGSVPAHREICEKGGWGESERVG